MRFLYNLDYLLFINKMSRSELARRISIAPSTINSWYSRDYKGITLKNLLKLSNCFDVSLEDLVNGDMRALTFSPINYTEPELEAIRDFSEYLKSKREI